MPMGLKHIGYARKLIQGIKKEIRDAFTGRKDFTKNMETAYRLIMSNMVGCTFARTSLSLPSTEKSYNKGTHYNKLFLTRAAVEAVVQALIREGYIKKNIGSKKERKVNSYQPTKKLQLLALPLLYKVSEEYKSTTELIIFKKPKDKKNKKGKKTIHKEVKKAPRALPKAQGLMRTMRRSSFTLDLPNRESDLRDLTRINKALKKCTYALKSPVKRIYSENHPMMGGRLYTRLQGLPDRRARIRINTLFNGEPIAEVDLSANHPRMLMALSQKELAPNFYDDVAKATKTTREQVKFFVVKAIGAKNKSISLKPKGAEDDWTSKEFILRPEERKKIEEHLQKHHPELTNYFYKNFGTMLQGLEGDILIKAMLNLLDQGISSLPMHDAIYVQQKHQEVAKDALEIAWMEELKVPFRPVTKIDKP